MTTTGLEYLTPESIVSVTTASSIAKADEKPRVIKVKKRATAQKFAPGICSMAVGRVWKPMEKPPTSGTSGPGNMPGRNHQLYAVVPAVLES